MQENALRFLSRSLILSRFLQHDVLWEMTFVCTSAQPHLQ
jgi:hypothetical protein